MIDIENKVINTVSNALTSAGETVNVTSEYPDASSEFPCVFIREVGNATLKKTQDASKTEHHATIRVRVEVYSNKKGTGKQEAKRIAGIVDTAMQGMLFTRSSFNFVPNYDRSIVRTSADYSVIADAGTTVGTTTTYQLYRS